MQEFHAFELHPGKDHRLALPPMHGFHLSVVTIPHAGKGRSTLYATVDGKSFAIATLDAAQNILQAPTDLIFNEQQQVVFRVKGNAVLHCCGYQQELDAELFDGDGSEAEQDGVMMDEESDEEGVDEKDPTQAPLNGHNDNDGEMDEDEEDGMDDLEDEEMDDEDDEEMGDEDDEEMDDEDDEEMDDEDDEEMGDDDEDEKETVEATAKRAMMNDTPQGRPSQQQQKQQQQSPQGRPSQQQQKQQQQSPQGRSSQQQQKQQQQSPQGRPSQQQQKQQQQSPQGRPSQQQKRGRE